MTSFSSETIVKAEGTHHVALKFSLNVSEYLKGTGPSKIVAVWVDGWPWDTNGEAANAKNVILAERDAQWDDREAVFFMYDDASGFGTTLDGQLERSDHFLLSLGERYLSDDRYSLHSATHKKWLPAASASSAARASSAGGAQEFLLDVPSSSGASSASAASLTTPTITLSNLKKRIKEIADELEGSDAYEECVKEKYELERTLRYYDQQGIVPHLKSPQSSNLKSGQPANAMLHKRRWYGIYPDTKAKTWFEGRDAALFSVAFGDATSSDRNGDGKLTAGVDEIRYAETFQTARPLPFGEYKIVRKEIWAMFLPCSYTLSFDWTITATAPVGAVHEAFFDPVNLTGGAIGADKDNGALKPTLFSVNGAATNIERIKWDPAGRVSVDLKPGVSLKGHLIEFIGLNGKPFLSLSFDRSAGTSAVPSWQVCDSPWKAGDLLMIRISAGATAFGEAAKVSPCPNAPAPTPTPKTPARGRG